MHDAQLSTPSLTSVDAMTSKQIETDHSAAPPSYQQLLETAYGLEAVEHSRAEAQATQGLGDPSAALGVGALAPPFALTDANGAVVELMQLLTHGPVVLIFYRGGWCPFCNVYLRAFQLARPQLRALGAQVVLISPEQAAHSRALIERHALLFPLLSDRGNRIARQYGLVFQMPQELRDEYLADGIDLAEHNGEAGGEVPMPATFVVAADGRIAYAFVSADYTQRAEPSAVLAVLRRLRTPRR
jgi:peroxiredoxin